MRTLVIALFSVWASAEVLVSTMAQVQNHVITSREVEIHKVLAKTLGGPIENFPKDSAVEQVIKEWLLYLEAKNFYSSKIPNSDIDKKVGVIQAKSSGKASYKKLQISPQELRDKVRRRLEAERIFNFKKKASVLPVASSEIEAEYTQNRVLYGNMSFDEAKPKIRALKTKQSLQKRLERWFFVLEKKYKVQRFFR